MVASLLRTNIDDCADDDDDVFLTIKFRTRFFVPVLSLLPVNNISIVVALFSHALSLVLFLFDRILQMMIQQKRADRARLPKLHVYNCTSTNSKMAGCAISCADGNSDTNYHRGNTQHKRGGGRK